MQNLRKFNQCHITNTVSRTAAQWWSALVAIANNTNNHYIHAIVALISMLLISMLQHFERMRQHYCGISNLLWNLLHDNMAKCADMLHATCHIRATWWQMPHKLVRQAKQNRIGATLRHCRSCKRPECWHAVRAQQQQKWKKKMDANCNNIFLYFFLGCAGDVYVSNNANDFRID